MIQAIDKLTGEIIEYSVENYTEILQAWRMASEREKVAKALKDQLKALVPAHIGTNGLSEPIDGYAFRLSNVQRMTYDKAVLRRAFDEDELDLVLKVDKPAVDRYLKEHLEELGELSTEIRKSMVEDGKAYEVIRLEKLA